MEEDIRSESDVIHVTCSLCDELSIWCYDEETAKNILITHLKEKHSNIYNPMELSIERQSE